MALNNVRENRKPRCKISYKVLKEEHGYEPLLEIFPYPTLIQLKDFLGGVHHCVSVVGKCIFDSNFTFDLPSTRENVDFCCINDNETKGMNGHKGLLKVIKFSPK